MDVSIPQPKMATFGMTIMYYFLTFQPTKLNDILIYDKLYSAKSTSISCLHLKPTLLLSYHLFCCYSERWRTMLHVLSQNLTLTLSKMTSVYVDQPITGPPIHRMTQNFTCLK